MYDPKEGKSLPSANRNAKWHDVTKKAPPLPDGMFAIICAISGINPAKVPEYVRKSLSFGYLSTQKQTHQAPHVDNKEKGLLSFQIPLSNDGFSVQMFCNRELNMAKEKKGNAQAKKVYCPPNHLLIWDSTVFHGGCFGTQKHQCPRYHGQVATTKLVSDHLISEFNSIHCLSNAGFPKDYIRNCDGMGFDNF